MNDEPVVDSTEDEKPEGERQLIKSQRNKFEWQAGDIQTIESRE